MLSSCYPLIIWQGPANASHPQWIYHIYHQFRSAPPAASMNFEYSDAKHDTVPAMVIAVIAVSQPPSAGTDRTPIMGASVALHDVSIKLKAPLRRRWIVRPMAPAKSGLSIAP